MLEHSVEMGKGSDGSAFVVEAPLQDRFETWCNMCGCTRPQDWTSWFKCVECVGWECCLRCQETLHHPHPLVSQPRPLLAPETPSRDSSSTSTTPAPPSEWDEHKDIELLESVWCHRLAGHKLGHSVGTDAERALARVRHKLVFHALEQMDHRA